MWQYYLFIVYQTGILYAIQIIAINFRLHVYSLKYITHWHNFDGTLNDVTQFVKLCETNSTLRGSPKKSFYYSPERKTF